MLNMKKYFLYSHSSQKYLLWTSALYRLAFQLPVDVEISPTISQSILYLQLQKVLINTKRKRKAYSYSSFFEREKSFFFPLHAVKPEGLSGIVRASKDNFGLEMQRWKREVEKSYRQ